MGKWDKEWCRTDCTGSATGGRAEQTLPARRFLWERGHWIWTQRNVRLKDWVDTVAHLQGMQCPPKAVHCLCDFTSKWSFGLGSRAPWLFKSPQKWSLSLISLQGEERSVSWESAVPPEAGLGSWKKSMCFSPVMLHSGGKGNECPETTASQHCSWQHWLHLVLLSLELLGVRIPPARVRGGGGGGVLHNQIPVLFWKDCSCQLYLKRRSFERDFFFFFDCHKRFTPLANDAPSNPFPFILLWLLVLWEERLDTRHTSLPVLLTQVTASIFFKWSGTKEGKGCRPRLSRATQPRCGCLRFPTSV